MLILNMFAFYNLYIIILIMLILNMFNINFDLRYMYLPSNGHRANIMIVRHYN